MTSIFKTVWHRLIPKSLRNYIYKKRCDIYDLYICWCKYHHKKLYADYLYKQSFGHNIDWKHPRDLNEIINVLAFTTDTTEWTRLADKYRMREHVKECGCEEILVPLYGHWETVADIDWNSLPQKFVLKCNNGCGDAIFIQDKDKISRTEVLKNIDASLHSSYGIESCEPHYLTIKPCVIAEEYLDNGDAGIVDYKVMCFNGNPYCIFTCSNRDISTHYLQVNAFDIYWNRMDNVISREYRNDIEVPRPLHLEQILEYAKKLSKGFPQVRVDFYEIKGKVYIGEFTFTSAAGRMKTFTSDFLKEMANQILIK